MCLLFLYLNDERQQCHYRLITASNRDEYWHKATGTAEVRGGRQQWIGGIDLRPGREGGSWIGMSKTGKFAALLNIYSKWTNHRKTRGMFVPDFLQSNMSSKEYMQGVENVMGKCEPFQFVCIDLSENPCCVRYINNRDQDKLPRKLSTGVHCFDNSSEFDTPWRKTLAGRTAFKYILSNCGSGTEKEKVVSSLFDLLADETQHLPDPQLAKQFEEAGKSVDSEEMKQISAINVWALEEGYSSRTNTVILVDFAGNCDYYERTLQTPVDCNNPKYSFISHSFKLDLGNNAH